MKLFKRKVNKVIFLSSIFLGVISPVNSEEVQSKFVQKITISEGATQIYLPKAGFFGGHETWSPSEPIKSVSIGDTISGSDYGKKKNRSFVVGVIQCDYQKEDYFDRFGSQYSWAGKWSCIAARSKNDIKEFYNFRKDRSVDVFTTNPINSEDIVDLSVSNNDMKLPIFVPLGQTDLDEPQKGYMHMSSGMEGGIFFFAKKGDPFSKFKTVNLEKFSFDPTLEKEVIDGFTPRFGACAYLSKGWGCFISDTWEGLAKTISQAYASQHSNIHLANYIFCEDCKPIPQPMMTRICPGYYSQYITGNEWKDKSIPTYPEFFTKNGDCIYEKPWVVSPKK